LAKDTFQIQKAEKKSKTIMESSPSLPVQDKKNLENTQRKAILHL
jgi:hypothetical protein